jgi:hypothetical protein
MPVTLLPLVRRQALTAAAYVVIGLKVTKFGISGLLHRI